MAPSKKRKPTDADERPVKTITSQKPDVTVIVGNGDSKQIFECYGVLLAYASPVFDAMLSSSMKEGESKVINLPTKDPDEWRLFLQCIDPAAAAGYFCEDKYFDTEFDDIIADNPDIEAKEKEEFLNESSIMRLVPWFHEFQMEVYLRTCDAVIYYSEIKYSDLHDSEEEKRLCNLLTFSKTYNLQEVQCVVRQKLEFILGGWNNDAKNEYECWWQYWCDCFPGKIWDPKISSHDIVSYEPDLTVIIGAKQFKCHKVILSFASTKLDSLVAASSDEDIALDLSNMDPDSWEKFYRCINPSVNAASINEAVGLGCYGHGFKTILLPWFKEFEMTKHLSVCYDKIPRAVKCLEARIKNYLDRRECMPIQEGIDILQVATKHQLEGSQVQVESLLHDWMQENLLQHCLYVDIKGFVSLCLPIQRNTRDAEFTSAGCQVLWRALNERIKSHLQKLTFDKVETTEQEIFSHLVYSFIRYDRYAFDREQPRYWLAYY